MSDVRSSTPAPDAAEGSPVQSPTIVVFGANGGSGRALVRQALAQGHRVRAVTRHPETFSVTEDAPGGGAPSGLEVIKGDSTDPRSVESVVAGADAVLSALGTPYTRQPVELYSTSALTIASAMRRQGVQRLAVVTSSALAHDAPSQGFVFDHVLEPLITRVLGRTLYADMRRMEKIVHASDLDWTIVRPAGLVDADSVERHRVATTPLAEAHTSRQDLADFLLTLATGSPSTASGHHDGFHQQTAYVGSPGAHQSVLTTIWRDGLGR